MTGVQTCALPICALPHTQMRLALTTGGRLARLGESLGYEVFSFEFTGQPRAALGTAARNRLMR